MAEALSPGSDFARARAVRRARFAAPWPSLALLACGLPHPGTAAAQTPPPPSCQLEGLRAPTDYPVAGSPRDAAAVHIAGGPRPDLAFVAEGLDQVGVLLNDGFGAFAPGTPIPLPAGSDAVALAAGDFADGRSLAVVERGAHRVRFLDPNGGPDLVVALPAGSFRAGRAVAGDLDGLGSEDLVVALEGDLFGRGGGVAVLRDAGGPPLVELLPAPPDGFARITQVVLADLDGDGDWDIAALRAPAATSPAGIEGVLLWENLGGGAFAYRGVLAAGEPVAALAAGYFDGSGRARLALALDGFPPGGPGEVRLLAHDGSPLLDPADFSTVSLPALGTLPVALGVADVGGEGLAGFGLDADLVALHLIGGETTLYRSFDPVPGDFAGSASCAFGGVPVALHWAHLDGDGVIDLVLVDGAGSLQVLLSDPAAVVAGTGAGCAGTAGNVPAIGASGAPTYGNGGFAVTLSNARPSAPAFLAIAPALSTLPIGFGCTLYVGPNAPLLPLSTTPGGTGSVPFPIPGDMPPFSGLMLVFQFAVLDPFGSFLGTYALSDALGIQIGT